MFTAAFTTAQCAARPAGDHTTVLETRKDIRFQGIIHQSTDFCGPEYDDMKTFTSGPHDQYHHSYSLPSIPVLPSRIQRVTTTGPWHHNLPDAICYAHFENTTCGAAKGDRFRSGEPPRRQADCDEIIYLDDD